MSTSERDRDNHKKMSWFTPGFVIRGRIARWVILGIFAYVMTRCTKL